MAMKAKMERKDADENGAALVGIDVPIGPVRVGGNQGKRFIDTRLEPADAALVARIADALILDGARLNSGRPVRSSDDVLAWFAQRVQACSENSS